MKLYRTENTRRFQDVILCLYRVFMILIFVVCASSALSSFNLYEALHIEKVGIKIPETAIKYWMLLNCVLSGWVIPAALGVALGDANKRAQLDYDGAMHIVAWTISEGYFLVITKVSGGFILAPHKDNVYDLDLAEHYSTLEGALRMAPVMYKKLKSEQEVS